MVASFVQKIWQAWWIKKIDTPKDLYEFLYAYSTKHAADVVIKYAQKRLGKIHYNLVLDDVHYSRELIRCQIVIHAEILADMGHLVAGLSKLSHVAESVILQRTLCEVHRMYVRSSPDWYDDPSDDQKDKKNEDSNSNKNKKYFDRTDKVLRDLSAHTGSFLFRLLPMTEHLQPSDVMIFQGQIRLIYIAFLEQLRKRIATDDLQKMLGHQRYTPHQ